MAAAGGGVTTADARSAPAGALQRQTKKLTYTSYEANSFKATFEQSGVHPDKLERGRSRPLAKVRYCWLA